MSWPPGGPQPSETTEPGAEGLALLPTHILPHLIPTAGRVTALNGMEACSHLLQQTHQVDSTMGAQRPTLRRLRRNSSAWAKDSPLQDVFLMIRRHKTTIFTDAKESSTVFELKRIVEGILKRPPDEQRLYKDDQLLDDGKTLGECGFTSQTARPQAPATVGLAFRADEAFEALRIEPFSSPPELPDVMKPQDSGSSANEQAVQ
uniref:Elongin-B n=1 Tax=Equus asinus TaxID=9793 RepID=A0A8C4LAT2_EQUAS